MVVVVVGLRGLAGGFVIVEVVDFERHVELVVRVLGALEHEVSVMENGPPGTVRCSSVRGMRDIEAPQGGSKVARR